MLDNIFELTGGYPEIEALYAQARAEAESYDNSEPDPVVESDATEQSAA